MRGIRRWFWTVRHRLHRVHLLDRCLILIMAILLVQAAFNLFENEAVSQETNAIDVIIRTSAASIFGYFISANFDRKKSGKDKSGKEKDTAVTSMETGEKESGRGQGEIPHSVHKLQIIVATSVGVFSLVALIIYRNFFEMAPAAAGTLSQFRDFVSACVGFLIGGARESSESE